MVQTRSMAILVPEIKELLQERNYVLLKHVIKEYTPLDFSDSWKYFSEEEQLQIFKLLPAKYAIKLFEIIDTGDQRFLLGSLNKENVAPLLEGIDSPDLAKLFHKMSPRLVKRMTSLMKHQEALQHIDFLMKFPEHTAGSLMHPEFIKLSPKMTAKQALVLLQSILRPNQKKHLSCLFVTDDLGRVLGGLNIQDLLSSPQDEQLSVIMESVEGVQVKPETDQEEVSKLFDKYHLTSVPVVDDQEKLIGVIMSDDILAVVRHEASEDIAKMVGTNVVDLGEKSLFKVVGFRMPWLVMTLLGGMIISLIIKSFEPILAKVIALASFSPLIAGMGGNVGSQSAMIMVRSLALGQLTTSAQKYRSIIREIGVGLMLGCIYGILMGVAAYVIYGSQYDIQFSIVVAVGMLTSMTVAATMGAIEPILFVRWGIDPATATGPLITTITDIISNMTYFTLATILFSGC